MYEMQTIVTDVIVCHAALMHKTFGGSRNIVLNGRSDLPTARGKAYLMQPLPNYFGLLFMYLWSLVYVDFLRMHASILVGS